MEKGRKMAVLKLDIVEKSNYVITTNGNGNGDLKEIGDQYSNVCSRFKFNMHGATHEQKSDIDYVIDRQIEWLLKLLSNYSNTSWCFEADNKLNKNINWMDNVEMFLFSAGIDSLSYLLQIKDKKVSGNLEEEEYFKILKAQTVKERVSEFGFYEIHWVKEAVSAVFKRLSTQKQYDELADTVIHTFGSQVYAIIFDYIHEERQDCTKLYSKWYGYKKAIDLPPTDLEEETYGSRSQMLFSKISSELGTLNNGNGSLEIGSIWASLRRANGFFSIRKLLPKFGIFEQFKWCQSISFEEAKVIHDEKDEKSREITGCALFNLYLDELDKSYEISDFYKATKSQKKKDFEFICLEWERFKESGYDSNVLGLHSITKDLKNKTKSYYLPKTKALKAKDYINLSSGEQRHGGSGELKGFAKQECIEKISKAMPFLLHLIILCRWVGDLNSDVKELDSYLNKYVLNVLRQEKEYLEQAGERHGVQIDLNIEQVRIKTITMLIGHHNGFGDLSLLFWLKGKDLLLPLLNCVRNQRMFSVNPQKRGHSKLIKHVFEQVDALGAHEEFPIEVWGALDNAKLLKKYCAHKKINFWDLSIVKSGIYFLNQVQKRTFYSSKMLEKLWLNVENKSFIFENLPTNNFLFARQSLLENKKYTDWLIKNIIEYEASDSKQKQKIAKEQKESMLYWINRQLKKEKEVLILEQHVDFFKLHAQEIYQGALAEENYDGAKWLEQLFAKQGVQLGALGSDSIQALKDSFMIELGAQNYKEVHEVIDEMEKMPLSSWGHGSKSVEQEKQRISFVQKCLGNVFSQAQPGSSLWCSAYEPSNKIDILKEQCLAGVASRLYVLLLEYQNSGARHKDESFVYDKDVLIFYFFKIATLVSAHDPKTQKYNKSNSLMNWLAKNGSIVASNSSILLDLDYISELFGKLDVPITMQWVYEADDTTMGHMILNHIIHEHPQSLWVSAYSDLPNYLLDSFWTWYPALDEKFILENFEDSYEKSLKGIYDKDSEEAQGFWLQNIKRVLDFDLWLFSKIDFSMETVLVSLNEQSRHSGALEVLLRLILEKQTKYFEQAAKDVCCQEVDGISQNSAQTEEVEIYKEYKIKNIYFKELKRNAKFLSNNFWYSALSNMDTSEAVKEFVKKEQERIKHRMYRIASKESISGQKVCQKSYDITMVMRTLKEMNYIFTNKEPFKEMVTVPALLMNSLDLIPYDFWISDIGEKALLGVIKKRKYVLYSAVIASIKKQIEQSNLTEEQKLECEKAWFFKMEKVLKLINKKVELARYNNDHDNGNKKILSWIESQKSYWHLVEQLDAPKTSSDVGLKKEEQQVKRKSFL